MTIVNRNGRYGVKVWEKGSKKYRWVGSFNTRLEAEQAESDASLKDRKDSPTVQQWSRVWLSDYARPGKSTQRTYRYAVKQISRELGALRLSEITRVQARQQAGKWPRGTSKVAKTMWADAKRDEVVDHNPWENLRLQASKGRKDLKALDEGEIAELAEIAREQHGEVGLEAKAIVLTLAYTGVRPGELFALRREDVDLAGESLTVGAVVPTKNRLPRIITLPGPAVQAIRAMAPQTASDRLFHSIRGKPLSKGNFGSIWRPIAAAWLERHGRKLQPYELRHSAATIMLERGLSPADVAAQLGHQDGGRLVQMLYGHPDHGRAMDRVRMAFAQAPDRMRETG
jgi:integrase